MEDYAVEKFWMYGVICIMAFYFLSFWVLTVLGKNKRAKTENDEKNQTPDA